jgi:branched-chain amino acid transport system permease protein
VILPPIVLALMAYPWVFTLPFPQHLMILVFLFAMLGQSWNILGGYAGQVSLGHATYFGIGAYTSTLLLIKLGITPWVGMIAGGLMATALSQVIGYPCFRLKGHYFVIATIVLAAIVHTLFINWQWAGGAVGLFIPLLPESFLSFEFHSSKVSYYYISFALLVVTMIVTYLIERSRLGYYFKAIKEDPDAARSLGIHITRYRMIAMAISAFFTGIGGSFYAQFVLFIDPDSVLSFDQSVLIALIPVLGGVGTLWGPVLGAFVMIPMSEFTRIYLGGGSRAVHVVVYGALIILVAVFQPKGLWAFWEGSKIRGKLVRADSSAKNTDAPGLPGGARD